MANLIPQDIREWMRRMEFKVNDLTRRNSNLIPGDIADSVDLDGYLSSGRWRRPSSTNTTTALHYPFNGAAGTLEVYWEPTSSQVQQIFYDRGGSVWQRWWNGTTWSVWGSTSDAGMPNIAQSTVAALQTINSGTSAVLPTNVSATLVLQPGTYLVDASVSCLVGSGVNFAPSSTGSVRYWLSGALVFQPADATAGVAGTNQPIGTGGGTLMRTHQVTVVGASNLTITAMGVIHQGTSVGVRDVTVQLVAKRRN